MKLEELKYSELIDIAGGETGSENGAYIFGKVISLLSPFTTPYRVGRNLGLW